MQNLLNQLRSVRHGENACWRLSLSATKSQVPSTASSIPPKTCDNFANGDSKICICLRPGNRRSGLDDGRANTVSDSVVSRNGVTVVLTDERWQHILHGHPEMARRRQKVLEAVGSPDRILEGNTGELLAVKQSGVRGSLVVVYREETGRGFIVTAFRSTRTASLDGRRQLWP